MLGNDIVDLDEAGNSGRGSDARLLARVAFGPERELVENAPAGASRDRALWSVWAAKEAAYKAFWKQGLLKEAFKPSRFRVSAERLSETGRLLEGSCALLSAEGREMGRIPIRWEHGERYVHALACQGEWPEPHIADEDVTLERLRLAGWPAARVAREWKDGWLEAPAALDEQGKTLPVRLSRSHDGRYFAAVFDQ